MDFHKFIHPGLCRFASCFRTASSDLTLGEDRYRVRLRDLGDERFVLEIGNRPWSKLPRIAEFDESQGEASRHRLILTPEAGLRLTAPGGRPLLESDPAGWFGRCGRHWLMAFRAPRAMKFYGLGEKAAPLEHTGRSTKFWNVDVWADICEDTISRAEMDPMYASIPYLLMKRGSTWIGLLVDNPLDVAMRIRPEGSMTHENPEGFTVGAPDGAPRIYLIVGPSPLELTRKLQALVGRAPRPPLWALGFHQSRWGYAGQADLDRLDRTLRRHRIQCDGLWLDIDYMDGFRVFTEHPRALPDPSGCFARLGKRGRRIVAILDPGVKHEPGYPVYEDGLREGIFCKTPEGEPFVGYVWPGATVFPDFSLPEGRAWWARHVERMAGHGYAGFWIDMNDPSAGATELEPMLFDHGRRPHAHFHNQYALGMAMATRLGLEAARPGERPFVLTRSASPGIASHAAIWNGDNMSNEAHLRGSIAMSLNLALSGVPYNGPDVGGFGWDCPPELLVDWFRAGFLFPFFRNHSAQGTAPQEPWVHGPKPLKAIRHAIALRYKLLPYLYQLAIGQEAQGDPWLRPMFMEFREAGFDTTDDQFMVGPALMHAPLLGPSVERRSIRLPKGRWFRLDTGRWIEGGRTLNVRRKPDGTPLFVRTPALIPMRPDWPEDPLTDLHKIELHVLMEPGLRGWVRDEYQADDGLTFGYQEGTETCVQWAARIHGKTLQLNVETIHAGAGPIELSVACYAALSRVEIRQPGHTPVFLELEKTSWPGTGRPIPIRRTRPIMIGSAQADSN